jgi:hypothetical protein
LVYCFQKETNSKISIKFPHIEIKPLSWHSYSLQPLVSNQLIQQSQHGLHSNQISKTK